MEIKFLILIFIHIFLLLGGSSCKDPCDYNECPTTPQIIHRINLIDSDQKSVYGSSTKQFDKDEIKINSSFVDFKFEDSLLLLIQRPTVNEFNISYNDTTSTKISVKYQSKSPNDECCSDYNWPSQTLIDNIPLCDTCMVITVEV